MLDEGVWRLSVSSTYMAAIDIYQTRPSNTETLLCAQSSQWTHLFPLHSVRFCVDDVWTLQRAKVIFGSMSRGCDYIEQPFNRPSTVWVHEH